MSNRIYCVRCETFFRKIKTGFNVDIPNSDMAVRGDLYECKCSKVLGDFGEPFQKTRGLFKK